ncbi:MAG: hypothetical protein LIP01_07980 [Tannerellaceae bacterium]|nr:hypothetical protein [Tannerellaceae bacterium]
MDAIRNPATFIMHSDCWVGDLATYHLDIAQFWNENETSSLENATKGVFDPCPDGWKTVPGTTDMQNDWYVLFGATDTNKDGGYSQVIRGKNEPGNTLGEDVNLGYWPHAGYINGSNGNITGTGSGRYWTGNKIPGANHQSIHSHVNEAHAGLNFGMTHALPVRCMRLIEERR